jgi:hypothetical protein
MIKMGQQYAAPPNADLTFVVNLTLGEGTASWIPYHEKWRELVVQYSQGKFTVPRDGLAAIGGLASRWSSDLTGCYFAGLWEKTLLHGLRWMRGTMEPEEPEKAAQYIAPSWSWASIQRGITWGDSRRYQRPNRGFFNDTLFVDVDFSRTRCHEDAKDSFPFGPVSAGYVFLKGQLQTVSFEAQDMGGYTPITICTKNGQTNLPRRCIDGDGRLQALQPRVLFVLRFCTKSFPIFGQGVPDADGTLLLAKPRRENLERQPEEVRQYGHVYERVGFTYSYWIDEKVRDEGVENVGLYVI